VLSLWLFYALIYSYLCVVAGNYPFFVRITKHVGSKRMQGNLSILILHVDAKSCKFSIRLSWNNVACTVCKAVNTKHRCAKGQILMNMPGIDVKTHATEVQSLKLKYVWITSRIWSVTGKTFSRLRCVYGVENKTKIVRVKVMKPFRTILHFQFVFMVSLHCVQVKPHWGKLTVILTSFGFKTK